MQQTAPTSAQVVSPTWVHRCVPEQTKGRSSWHIDERGAHPLGGGRVGQPLAPTAQKVRTRLARIRFMVGSTEGARTRLLEKDLYLGYRIILGDLGSDQGGS